MKDRIKDTLDMHCYKVLKAKRCKRYNDILGFLKTPCWLCDENTLLTEAIVDAIKESVLNTGRR